MTPPAPEDEKPPVPRRAQTPKQPVLRRDTPALDQQPERRDVRHVGVDGAPQRPLRRTATMPNMAALKAPPVAPGIATSLPGPAALPTEHAATVPSPANPRLTETWHRETSPAELVAARRTEPPLPGADENTLQSPLATTLPPASEDPKVAVELALRRRLEAAEAKERDAAAKASAAEAKVAELERQARVRAEAQAPGPFELPVSSAGAPSSVVVTGKQGERGERGKPSSLISQLPAILIATTGLVTALAAIWKPAPDTKADEAYTAIREELVKQNKALQANADSDEARFNVVIGLFKATGVKVTEAPGTPKIEPLQLQPAPLTNKVSPSSAPAIQVRDPLPPPVPSVAPVRLPVTLDSLKSDKGAP